MRIFLIFLIIFFISYATLGINKPWGSEHNGYIGAEKALIAYNYIKYGYFKNKFGQLYNINESLDTRKATFYYQIHHPALSVLLISFSFLMFGVREWSTRLVPILLNVVFLYFFYLILKEIGNKKIGVITILFLIFSPIFFLCRNFATTEIIGIISATVLLYYYIVYTKTMKRKYLYILFFLTYVGTISDWTFYFILPPIIAHFLVINRFRLNGEKKYILVIPIICAFMFFVFLVDNRILTGSFFGRDIHPENFYQQILFRMNLNEASKQYNITPIKLLQRLYDKLNKYYTSYVFDVLIAFGIIQVFLFNNREFDELKKSFLIILILLSYLAFLFIFSNYFWIHEFSILILFPGIFLLFSFNLYTIDSIIARVEQNSTKVVLSIVFILLISIFFVSFVRESYPTIKVIYEESNNQIPLVSFISSKINKRVLTGFKDSPYDMQLRYYTSQMDIRDVINLEEFEELKDEYDMLIMRDLELDQNLTNYLEQNYRKEVIEDPATNYTIYYLKTS